MQNLQFLSSAATKTITSPMQGWQAELAWVAGLNTKAVYT